MNVLDEYNAIQALKYNSYAKSVHGIGKAMLVVEVFADMGEWHVVLRDKHFRYSTATATEFVKEYPIRLKRAGSA